MCRRLILLFLPMAATALLGARLPSGGDAQTLSAARLEARQAIERYQRLDRQAREATSEAERARAEGEALAARIEAAEADLTAAERRISMLDAMQVRQRERLAARQQPLVRLTAALQTMARRPAALALVQPGSVQDTIHVRSLLAATLPEIRRRTAALRAEVDRSKALRRRSEQARLALAASREALGRRRVELAAHELAQRQRSRQYAGLALSASDEALAFSEAARSLARLQDRREVQQALAARLSRLPGPLPRPGSRPEPGKGPYLLPVEGRLLTGVGEISDGGVHSRGLLFETAAGAEVRAPGRGRVAFAAPFAGYDHVVIIDHGSGWSSVVTRLARLRVAAGQVVERGALLGVAGDRERQVSLELRRDGRPVPVAGLMSR